ncbi:MAG TPA: MarR family transcriptional regulator [Candidatus Omnitrophota bacterium]|nr:MAG: Multiple antibiotic resistance protein MarR [Candidatus Omnitrophica bacterium ADurb.Bin314]HOE69180.1 MarR family transcriptional regulator [Candidatus Omnitrophota bacterium]HQB94841.1 MarR family transcriptional regulator [Candidatus Omnitrophota bacterium]
MNQRDEFTHTFGEMQPKFSRLYANILTRISLTVPQFVLLNQIRLSGTISMTDASKRLGITKPAITHLVDKLEEKKLLKRTPHAEDRRVILLEIQPKGEKIVADIHSYSLQMLLTAYDRFDASGQKTIRRFHSAISRELDHRLMEISK